MDIFEESYFGDIMGDLYWLLDLDFEENDKIVKVYSIDFYKEIKNFIEMQEVLIKTKYKTLD